MSQNDIAGKDVAVFVGVVERMLERVNAQGETERSSVYERCMATTRKTVETMPGDRAHSLIDAMRTAIVTVERRFDPVETVGAVLSELDDAAEVSFDEVTLPDDFADGVDLVDSPILVAPVDATESTVAIADDRAPVKGFALSGLLRRFSRSRETAAA